MVDRYTYSLLTFKNERKMILFKLIIFKIQVVLYVF